VLGSGLSGFAFLALFAPHRVSFILTLLHLSNTLPGPVFIPGGDPALNSTGKEYEIL